LKIHAGDEPVVVVFNYCEMHRIVKDECNRLAKHICTESGVLCRSKRSVMKDPRPVGLARVAWEAFDKRKCGIGITLSQQDVENAAIIGDKTNPVGAQNEFILSLISMHCKNLLKFHGSCFCSEEVRNVLHDALFNELESFRWSSSSSHYIKLGVDRGVEVPDIKRAYRKLSFQLHPDRNQNNEHADERMFMLNEAYECLSNPETRVAHDREQFGNRYVATNQLPSFQVQVSNVFGSAAVSVDANGNLKIVL